VVTPLTLNENMLFMVELINTSRGNAYLFTREGKQAASLKFAASLCVHTHLLLLRNGLCVYFVLAFQD